MQFVYKPAHEQTVRLELRIQEEGTHLPVANARVILREAAHQEEFITDSNGSALFVLRGVEGTLRVDVESPGHMNASAVLYAYKRDLFYEMTPKRKVPVP